jgi:hypothetical protein
LPRRKFSTIHLSNFHIVAMIFSESPDQYLFSGKSLCINRVGGMNETPAPQSIAAADSYCAESVLQRTIALLTTDISCE